MWFVCVTVASMGSDGQWGKGTCTHGFVPKLQSLPEAASSSPVRDCACLHNADYMYPCPCRDVCFFYSLFNILTVCHNSMCTALIPMPGLWVTVTVADLVEQSHLAFSLWKCISNIPINQYKTCRNNLIGGEDGFINKSMNGVIQSTRKMGVVPNR